jgi:hypothetical protein
MESARQNEEEIFIVLDGSETPEESKAKIEAFFAEYITPLQMKETTLCSP